MGLMSVFGLSKDPCDTTGWGLEGNDFICLSVRLHG